MWALFIFSLLPLKSFASNHACAFEAQQARLEPPPALNFEGPPPPGLTEADVQTALKSAVENWNSVGCSEPLLIENSLDASPIKFVESDPCLPDGFLAFTIFACGEYPFGTILFNTRDYLWQTQPSPLAPRDESGRLKVDLEAALTHEIGHVLGLGHLDHPLSTMAARYLEDGGQSSLASADKVALCDLNDRWLRECQTDSDCPHGPCLTIDEHQVCEEERGELGDYCGAELLICEICVISSPNTLTGYCSSPCGDCPAGYECSDGTCLLSSIDPLASCATSNPSAPFGWWIVFAILLWAQSSIRRQNAQKP